MKISQRPKIVFLVTTCKKKRHLEKFMEPKQYEWRIKISQRPRTLHRLGLFFPNLIFNNNSWYRISKDFFIMKTPWKKITRKSDRSSSKLTLIAATTTSGSTGTVSKAAFFSQMWIKTTAKKKAPQQEIQDSAVKPKIAWQEVMVRLSEKLFLYFFRLFVLTKYISTLEVAKSHIFT